MVCYLLEREKYIYVFLHWQYFEAFLHIVLSVLQAQRLRILLSGTFNDLSCKVFYLDWVVMSFSGDSEVLDRLLIDYSY